MRATLDDGRTVVNPVAATGCTFRQLDHWVRKGYLHVSAGGSGQARAWPLEELRIAAAMRRITRLGIQPRSAAFLARSFVVLGVQTVGPTDEGITIRFDNQVAELNMEHIG